MKQCACVYARACLCMYTFQCLSVFLPRFHFITVPILTLQMRTLSSLCFFTEPVFHGLTCRPHAVQNRFSNTVELFTEK